MRETTGTTSAPDRIADDVFITPRVLDATAYREYVESLKALIRDAEDRGSRLSATTTDTQKLCATIREAAQRLQERTTLGGQIADLLGERTTRAETLVDRLASVVSNDQELERLADMVIEKRRAVFEQRVADSIEDLFGRYAEAEKRAQEAERRAEQAQRALEAGERRLAELEPRIDVLSARAEQVLAQAESSIDALTSRLAGAVAEAQTEHERLRALTGASIEQIKRTGAISLDQAERDIDALRQRSAETVRATQEGADRAVTKALEAIDQLRVLATDIALSTDHDAASLEQRLGPFRDLIDRAERVLGNEDQPGLLTSALECADALRTGLEATGPSLAEHIDRAERVQHDFEQAFASASEKLAAMEAHRAEICESLEREIEAIGGDLSPIERAAAGLRLRIDQLEKRGAVLAEQVAAQESVEIDADPRLDRLRVAADEITAAALQRTEEAGMWLVKLIKRAEEVQADGDSRDAPGSGAARHE
ncbi:MAG: hypothetical protein H6810_12325 [Phycisphaeraceae bacterium]|nr:MAG: hypothetical protein H6810_12325 [Phycisphaeraceae bacterium]